MAETFFELDAEAFKKFLEARGFLQLDTAGEVVYVRRHHRCPHLMVKVYTTIPNRRKKARENGADAIRIVAIFDNGTRSFGVGKFPRIYRRAPDTCSGTEKNQFLFERVLKRMRAAYGRCNQWCDEKTIKYSKTRGNNGIQSGAKASVLGSQEQAGGGAQGE